MLAFKSVCQNLCLLSVQYIPKYCRNEGQTLVSRNTRRSSEVIVEPNKINLINYKNFAGSTEILPKEGERRDLALSKSKLWKVR